MLWETSLLDADKGITFRGYSIPQLQVHTEALQISGAIRVRETATIGAWCWCLQAKLPKVKDEPLPEGLLWLLLTGTIPTPAQVASVTEDLRSRSKMPAHVLKVRITAQHRPDCRHLAAAHRAVRKQAHQTPYAMKLSCVCRF